VGSEEDEEGQGLQRGEARRGAAAVGDRGCREGRSRTSGGGSHWGRWKRQGWCTGIDGPRRGGWSCSAGCGNLKGGSICRSPKAVQRSSRGRLDFNWRRMEEARAAHQPSGSGGGTGYGKGTGGWIPQGLRRRARQRRAQEPDRMNSHEEEEGWICGTGRGRWRGSEWGCWEGARDREEAQGQRGGGRRRE